MDGVREAIDRGDADALNRAAHTLKGVVANFASPPSYEAALRLEQMGRGGELAGARAAFATLTTTVGHLESALRALG
jgi:HPt (histidine-containing phosphotransfer) domain-containing protein